MAKNTNCRRGSTAAYTIPQRRGGEQEAEPRGLGDLDYGNWKLILLYRQQGGFGSPSKQAPFKLSVPPKSEVDAFDEHLQTLILSSESDSVAYIHLPKQLPLEEGAAEVLQWFSDISQELGAGDAPITDTGAQLALPSTLSPEERKRWHQIARTAGLYSASSGLRENRRMLIHASAAEIGEQWNKRDLKAQAEAREAHELLCEAHGGHSSYSVSELEEMIVSGVPLPPEILTQKTVKLAAAELWEALDAGKARTAVRLLRDTEYPRELACRRNTERSSYPIHAAVSGNMPEVAIELASPARYAGVFTQRDSSGRTALGLACSNRNIDLVIAFMNAGARDAGGDIDGLHRTLIRCGDHASRRLLNACPYTTAFRRKILNGGQKQLNKPQQGDFSQQGQSSQSRRQGTQQHRQVKEQENGGSPSASVSADESSGGQTDAPKEASRRRLAATGVNSLRALLKQNAVALATPSPLGKAVEEQSAKQLEQPARVRRGRGRFQGSEQAAAGDASEPSLRHGAQDSKATAGEHAGDGGSHAAAPHPATEQANEMAQSHAPYPTSGAAHPQDTRQGQAVPVQTDRGQQHMHSMPEHAKAMPGPQQAGAVQYIAAGPEHHMHQGGHPGAAGAAPQEGRVGPHYSAYAQPQYAPVAPSHAQMAVATHPQQPYAAGNYTYVTTSAPPAAASPAAPAEQAPGQNQMYILVTGQDGGQYLLPVMEAQAA